MISVFKVLETKSEKQDSAVIKTRDIKLLLDLSEAFAKNLERDMYLILSEQYTVWIFDTKYIDDKILYRLCDHNGITIVDLLEVYYFPTILGVILGEYGKTFF